MTIRLPKKTWVDRILKLFGAKRKIRLPDNHHEVRKIFGPYVQVRAKWQKLIGLIYRK